MNVNPGLRNQRGVIVIWFALFMLLMLSFLALGIDVAKLMATRTQLQNAADAAALAGASAIDSDSGELDQPLAVARAQATALKNAAFRDGMEAVVLAADDVTFPGQNRIRVVVRREGADAIRTHVAQVLGLQRLEMTALAVAQADTARRVDCGLAPIAVTPPAGQGAFDVGCGTSYRLKMPDHGGASGTYAPVIFMGCKYGPCRDMDYLNETAWTCLMENGYCCPVERGENLPVSPHDLRTPMKRSINKRFAADTDQRENICYDDYRGNGRRVMYVPITSSPVGGAATVSVQSFAPFFIESRIVTAGGNELVGHFIHGLAPGAGGGGHGPPLSGPVTYSVRLIQ